MSGANRTRSLVCSEKSTRVSHYRQGRTIRHSLRDGVNCCSVLSPVSARTTRLGRPQAHRTSDDALRPSHPASYVRDDAQRPSCGGGTRL
jgi:hypothetical protein